MVNIYPCGASDKSFVHYMATPGSKNLVQWKVIHPSSSGNCTVKLGPGGDEDTFIILKPKDGSGNSKGSFPCGRDVGYESKEFKFPKNYSCDSCTLQFEFATSYGKIHQCADIYMQDQNGITSSLSQ